MGQAGVVDEAGRVEHGVDGGGPRRALLGDVGVAFGALVVLVALLVGVVAFVGVRAWQDRRPPVAGDLERFDEIELREVAGADVTVGVTRSGLLPMVVHRSERQATSLAVIDAAAGTVIDGGSIPVDGWVGDGYPRASDRYVAMIHGVCSGPPAEGDVGLECDAREEHPTAAQLSVFDVEAQTWAYLPLGDPEVDLVLEDVDGATAVVKRYPQRSDEKASWAEIPLDRPLALGTFSAEPPAVRPNGLATRQGHIDGFGWKVRDVDSGEDATWVGTVDGKQETIEISTRPLRHLYGAGRCMVIGSYSKERLDHLHRLCADP